MKRAILLIAALLANGIAVAAESASNAEVSRIKGVLAQIMPGTPDSITATPMQGLYEVAYGPQLFYISADGRFLVNGEMFDIQKRTSLTEQRRAQARLAALNGLDQSSMIVYPANGKAKHTITVFTDIDCGYCRKLHQGMAEMNKLGITVRYLSFPRAGIGSDSFKKAGGVWCSKDRNKAMDRAKSNQQISATGNCDTPIKSHMALAESFGVNGTPAIVLDDGRLVPGYLPPQQLLAELERKL